MTHNNHRGPAAMKTTIIATAIASLLAIAAIIAVADVEPASVQLDCVRDAPTIELASSAYYYRGDTLSTTNSVMYSGTSVTGSVQDLTGCVITQVVGDASSAVTNAGYIIVATAGTWGASCTLPAVSPAYIEVSVTDSNGVRYTYQQQQIRTKAHL